MDAEASTSIGSRVALILLLGTLGIVTVVRSRVADGGLTRADEARLAIVREAVRGLKGAPVVCVGERDSEIEARPRNPSRGLFLALRRSGRIVPLTQCVDHDEESGQRPGAFFIEVQPLEWRGDASVSATVETWSSGDAPRSTRFTARRSPLGWSAAESQVSEPGNPS